MKRGEKLGLMVLVVLLVVLVVVGILYHKANPQRPRQKAGKPLWTKPKEKRVSSQWKALLRRQGGVSFRLKRGQEKEWEENWSEIMRQRWPEEPLALKRVLQKKASELKRLKGALASAGCLPVERELTSHPSGWNYISLVRGVKLLVARSVLLLQRGEVHQAVERLRHLLERLYFYEQRCQLNLIGVMVMVAALEQVQRGVAFALYHPKLSTSDLRILWRQIRRWERRPTAMKSAFRWEGLFRRQVILKLLRGTKKEKKELKRVTSFRMPLWWPFYDEQDTLELSDQLTRCHIKLAQKPPQNKGWPLCPVERYLSKLREQPAWLMPFRYNAIGKILLSIAVPSFRKYAYRWHQSGCLFAALRAQALQARPAFARILGPQERGPKPKNPFTGKPFSRLALKKMQQVCAFPSSSSRGGRWGGQALYPPPPPPPAPTPFPSSSPSSSRPRSQPRASSSPAPSHTR